MRLILFLDGRYPRRAWPVLAEYIRPNVYPRKSNSSYLADACLLLVDRELQLSHDLAQSLQGLVGFALPAQDHEIVGVGHDARAEALLQPEHLPPRHKPAHVEICQQW
jgi:hypothetical protein